MKIQIENMDIWQCHDALYCKRSDGNLIKIQSQANSKILEVIHHIQQEKSMEDFSSEDVSREEFGEIVRFLLSNHIISKQKEKNILEKQIGFYGNDKVLAFLQNHFRAEGYQLTFVPLKEKSQIQHLHLILVISPVFDYYTFLQELSDESYKSMTPLLYAEFSPTTFSIGPLVVPLMGTPSLQCYMKRKAVNLRNLGLYSEFIEAGDKEKCHEANICEFPYFNIGMQLISMEIERFWDYKGVLSTDLMAKSIVINFSDYQIEKSRILKDPLSPLFQRSTYAPFNG